MMMRASAAALLALLAITLTPSLTQADYDTDRLPFFGADADFDTDFALYAYDSDAIADKLKEAAPAQAAKLTEQQPVVQEHTELIPLPTETQTQQVVHEHTELITLPVEATEQSEPSSRVETVQQKPIVQEHTKLVPLPQEAQAQQAVHEHTELIPLPEETQSQTSSQEASAAELAEDSAVSNEEVTSEAPEEVVEIEIEIPKIFDVLQKVIRESQWQEAEESAEPEGSLMEITVERAADEGEAQVDEFCELALKRCAAETCVGQDVGENSCEKSDSGYAVRCSCSSGSSSVFSSSISSGPELLFQRSPAANVMFGRRFGPFAQPRMMQDPFFNSPFELARPRTSVSPFLMNRNSPFSNGENDSMMESMLESIMRGVSLSGAADPSLEEASSFNSGFSFSRFAPSRFAPSMFSVSMPRDETEEIPVTVEFLPIQRPLARIFVVDAEPAEVATEDLTTKESDSAEAHPGVSCVFVMVLFFTLIFGSCCCCCARRPSVDTQEVSVDVVDVDAYTPLVATYVREESVGSEPFKPLEHKSVVKEYVNPLN